MMGTRETVQISQTTQDQRIQREPHMPETVEDLETQDMLEEEEWQNQYTAQQEQQSDEEDDAYHLEKAAKNLPVLAVSTLA